MSRLARWFVLLGVAALLPAAVLLGSTVGELMRRPSLGMDHLLEHEALVIGLALAATFLFSTAGGLRDSRTWALVIGMAQAVLLMAAGLGALGGGARLMEWVGAAPQLVLATVPLSLAAMLLGARLLGALWRESNFALPFGLPDLRALAALLAVVGVAVLGHVLVVRLAS